MSASYSWHLFILEAIKNDLAYLYSLCSTSPLSRWLLVNILWHDIYKCRGMAVLGILGTLQSKGLGRAGFEQNGSQHSMWSSAGNQTHSFPSTKIKSPSTDIISVKISVTFLQNCITGKAALTLALAEACHWRRATLGWNISMQKWKSAIVTCARSLKAPWCPFLRGSRVIPSQLWYMHRHAHIGSADVQGKQSTDQSLHWNQGKAFWLLQQGQLAIEFPGNQESCGRGSSPLVGDHRSWGIYEKTHNSLYNKPWLTWKVNVEKVWTAMYKCKFASFFLHTCNLHFTEI